MTYPDTLDWDELQDPGRPEWYAVATIQLGELLETGVISYEWFQFDAYDEDQRARLWKKIIGRFEWREIGILPPGRWMSRFLAKLDEVMPKYKQLYKALEDGATVLGAGSEYHKARDVFSSFPQTALGGSNVDYATSGNDREHETIRDAGLLDVGERMPLYNDVDVMILDELEPLFFGLVSTTLPYL